MDLSFVILTFNSVKYIKKCIESYSLSIKGSGFSAEFLIVDNGSVDGTVELVKDKLLPALPACCSGRIFRLEKNFGTTISRNIALKEVLGKYIVVCDSDTEFIQGDWVTIFNYFKTHSEVGIIAPYLCYENGSAQESVRLFPTMLDKLMKLHNICFGLPLDRSDLYSDFPWQYIKPVDTVASAFWIFPKGLLNEVGYLDENIFYAPEDVDFCLRVWKASKEVIFYPKLIIMHRVQRLSHRRPFSYLALLHFLGLIYYFQKHKYFFSRAKIYRELSRI